MEVYLLNIFIGTVLCVPHAITNVTVTLMSDLYPRWESNPQAEATSFKPVVYTSSTTGMCFHQWDYFGVDVHSFPIQNPSRLTA